MKKLRGLIYFSGRQTHPDTIGAFINDVESHAMNTTVITSHVDAEWLKRQRVALQEAENAGDRDLVKIHQSEINYYNSLTKHSRIARRGSPEGSQTSPLNSAQPDHRH